jgi:hypothetical protein
LVNLRDNSNLLSRKDSRAAEEQQAIIKAFMLEDIYAIKLFDRKN